MAQRQRPSSAQLVSLGTLLSALLPFKPFPEEKHEQAMLTPHQLPQRDLRRHVFERMYVSYRRSKSKLLFSLLPSALVCSSLRVLGARTVSDSSQRNAMSLILISDPTYRRRHPHLGSSSFRLVADRSQFPLWLASRSSERYRLCRWVLCRSCYCLH